MGCDIHIWAEKQNADGSSTIDKLDYASEPRCYGAFAFLADVRNYAGIEPLSEPRGIPTDCPSDLHDLLEDGNYHSHSWFTLDELNDVDYDKPVENRRYSAELFPGFVSGSLTAPVGQGKMIPLRHLISEQYVSLFKRLKDEGCTRIIFAFDN